MRTVTVLRSAGPRIPSRRDAGRRGRAWCGRFRPARADRPRGLRILSSTAHTPAL